MPKQPPLSETHPELAAEAMFDATTITAGSNKKMPWKCAAHGHEWSATVGNRTSARPTGCPFCSNHDVLAGYNDLHTTHPEIAAEAMFDPTTVVAGTGKKLPWKCADHGHRWEAVVASRTGGRGCPFCSNNEVLAGYNDLHTTHPEIAAEAMFDPTTVIAGSNKKKMPWKCSARGHEWEAFPNSRTGVKNTGCPFCSNNEVLAGYNDLHTTHPEIAAEAMFDPTTVTAGSDKKMPWKCAARGHEWESSVEKRTGRNQGCPVCSNNEVLAGYNDLHTTHPNIAKEADFDPTTVVAGSNTKMPWKCAAHGHKWEATVFSRTGNKTGCPVCSDYGFNPGEPAWLYLMRHPEWLLQQIGKTNHIEDRLKDHTRNGWEVLDIRGPMDGYLTQNWEASILRWLTSRNIPRAASGTKESPHFDTPNSGEAWQQSDLNVTSVREIMDLVEADGQ